MCIRDRLNLDERGVWINERENFERFNTDGNINNGDTTDRGDETTDQSPPSPEEVEQPEFEQLPAVEQAIEFP